MRVVDYLFIAIPALISLLFWHIALSRVSPFSKKERLVYCAIASIITLLCLVWYSALIITWLEVLQ